MASAIAMGALLFAMVAGLKNFIERIDKILNKKNLSMEEKVKTIDAISFLILLTNGIASMFAGYEPKDKPIGAAIATIITLLASKGSMVFDWVAELFNKYRPLNDEQ